MGSSQAEGIKKSEILKAEGEKELMILRAQAKRDAMIAEAQGKAKPISIINEAKPSQEYLQLESYIAMVKVVDGQSTKLIVPRELQNLVTAASVFKESIKNDQ